MNYETIISDYFNQAQEIIIYVDGNIESYSNNTQEYDKLLSELLNLTKSSLEMPAYAVSLDNDIRDALTKGVWIELNFVKPLIHNEMPFERLLIQVDSEYTGFNLIRLYNGKYEGRCFYLNTTNNMSQLYTTIQDLI